MSNALEPSRRGAAFAQPDGASRIDQSVGTCLRLRRLTLGYSQRQLARKVGIAPQQLQKYEDGLERVSAAALQGLARALAVPVSWFFSAHPRTTDAEDVDRDEAAEQEERIALIDETNAYLTEVFDLVKTFMFVDDPPRRRRLAEVLRAIAGELDRKL